MEQQQQQQQTDEPPSLQNPPTNHLNQPRTITPLSPPQTPQPFSENSENPKGDDDGKEPQQQRLSSPSPLLRFPKPQGSQILAEFLSNSSPNIMQPANMSEPSNLADSAFEFINTTDTESQDGRLSESTDSLSVPQPDDVHSINGSVNNYDTDSDEGDNDSDHSSHASSLRYADEVLQNPSTQPPTSSNLDFGSSSEGSGIVVSQEEKDDPVLLENISVNQCIKEFSEEESATLAERLSLQNTPKRLVATIRQTMSQSYLSTQEPLRILYIGHPGTQRSIVLKICGALWASPKNGEKDQDYFNRHREGVYNIVPISSFGPAPELDLMEASHYQIKVEHCTSAEEERFEDSTTHPSVYSLTIEHDNVYKSHISPSGRPLVNPKWILPHVAVFYCEDKDEDDATATRDAAWACMKRHSIPCIFISEHQDFTKSATGKWADYVDEHAVHLCLESRDPEKPMPSKRFPIDLASFENIDARQMNRNLAYLTGLSEPDESFVEVETSPTKEAPEFELVEYLGAARQVWARFVESEEFARLRRLLVPFVIGLLLFPTLWMPNLVSQSSGPLSQTPFLGQTPSVVQVSSVSPISSLNSAKTSTATSTTTKTVVISLTSTQTVQLGQSRPSTSTLASALSFAGLPSDKPPVAPVEPEVKKPFNPTSLAKNTVCSVQISGPNEFVVDLVGRNKAWWFAADEINIDAYRGDERLETKTSPFDGGILVQLAPRDAHGILKVSVVSTGRSRINETCEVDFGKPAVAEVLEASLQKLQDAFKKASFGMDDRLGNILERGQAASHQAKEAVSRVKSTTKESIAHGIANGAKVAEDMVEQLDIAVLQAQVASRLWWLKLQGRMEEHDQYQRNASIFIQMKIARASKAKEAQKDEDKTWGGLWKIRL
ncbi:hypothetical protein QBC38DRAFT_507164 [Podospora fimiseda]|uniref:Uncharacterized protein n=1 Tax=Podospora fimiseda TaxID=252190 RepID=A0AAN7H4J3_9PEZI|nr:hypothetical protein QBC38DRAFT_507164 [Podospora fimiseda]